VARVAQFYLEVPFSFEAAMHGDSAMLICPAGSEIGRIVGDNGMVVSQLKGLLGLRRLSVVRLSASQEPLGRLRSAVQHVTGLSNMQFFIQSAAAQKQLPNGEPPLPAVLVKKKDVAKFVGKNGSNLYFIRRLSGVSFRHLDVQEQVVFARNEELRARKRTRMQQKQQEAEEAMRAAREAVDEARCEGVVTPKRTGTDDVRS
jgi:transcription antitermination factor NusA-like protein